MIIELFIITVCTDDTTANEHQDRFCVLYVLYLIVNTRASVRSCGNKGHFTFYFLDGAEEFEIDYFQIGEPVASLPEYTGSLWKLQM